MKLINKIFDSRIQAYNMLFEINLEDYLNISKTIIEENQFQRRRVKSSSTIYSLLKNDLMIGCIIPPIVLALSKNADDIDVTKNTSDHEIIELINKHIKDLIILDGLQRTYTIRDLFKDLEKNENKTILSKVKSKKIRIEIYLGLNKLGILYRMLTLNTGQTPMSIRHQIEILYSDYLNQDIDGIKLLLEVDDKSPQKLGEYKFKDIIEGFNSYLEREYLTLNRNDILENIKGLEKLSSENQDKDLFIDFLNTYHKLVLKFIDKSNSWKFNSGSIEPELSGQPFGKTSIKIFTKSQVMTGFGSAIGKLIDFELLEDITSVVDLFDNVTFSNEEDSFNNLIVKLDKIRIVAKKIGNDQRMFFHFFFRELFDNKGEAYLNINSSIDEAYSTYLRKTQ